MIFVVINNGQTAGLFVCPQIYHFNLNGINFFNLGNFYRNRIKLNYHTPQLFICDNWGNSLSNSFRSSCECVFLGLILNCSEVNVFDSSLLSGGERNHLIRALNWSRNSWNTFYSFKGDNLGCNRLFSFNLCCLYCLSCDCNVSKRICKINDNWFLINCLQFIACWLITSESFWFSCFWSIFCSSQLNCRFYINNIRHRWFFIFGQVNCILSISRFSWSRLNRFERDINRCWFIGGRFIHRRWGRGFRFIHRGWGRSFRFIHRGLSRGFRFILFHHIVWKNRGSIRVNCWGGCWGFVCWGCCWEAIRVNSWGSCWGAISINCWGCCWGAVGVSCWGCRWCILGQVWCW